MGTIVDDIMIPKPVTVSKEETLQRAIDLMNRNSIKRLIITNLNGVATGIVSRADLVNCSECTSASTVIGHGRLCT